MTDGSVDGSLCPVLAVAIVVAATIRIRQTKLVTRHSSNQGPSMNAISHPLDAAQYIALTTYRKNGTPVVTPLWFASDGGKLYAYSEKNAGKIKRIRANAKVEVAACSVRGTVSGPSFGATAVILDADQGEYVHRLLNGKYTWKKRVVVLAGAIPKLFRQDKGADDFIAITLD